MLVVSLIITLRINCDSIVNTTNHLKFDPPHVVTSQFIHHSPQAFN